MGNLFDKLVIYKIEKDDILYRFLNLIEKVKSSHEEELLGNEEVYSCIHDMIDQAEKGGLSGNLWKVLLTRHVVNDENSFSLGCEVKGNREGSLTNFAKRDLSILYQAYNLDFSFLEDYLGQEYKDILQYNCNISGFSIYNKRISECINSLSKELSSCKDEEAFCQAVILFYKNYGVGDFGLHKAFRLDDNGNIVPVTKTNHAILSDLIGYDSQKKELVRNTESFIKGLPANNCLLFGDAGTGKSTAVKAILNEYYPKGLRMIEVFKHQFKDLEKVLDALKGRNYKFIIYMDDLSFEDFETDYKYLKAIIEGGLEKKPENVLIYATSNRRHLIREKYSDKLDNENMHKSDTVQEKLSLSYRFGVSIYFGAPDHKEFDNIVLGLKNRYNIDMSDQEILLKANQFELRHGGLSGRTAKQFIDYIRG